MKLHLHIFNFPLFLLLILLTLPVHSSTARSESRPYHLDAFTSDGCSRSPDGTPFQSDKWLHCCVQHDVWYWIGGSQQDRQQADTNFYQCIQATGNKRVATLYYQAVRIFGGPNSNASYRWGYGWDRPRPYRDLSPSEMNLRYDIYREVQTDFSYLLAY